MDAGSAQFALEPPSLGLFRRLAELAKPNAIEPMLVPNMREHGVRSVDATCVSCRHAAKVNRDALPDDRPVPEVALRLRCAASGSERFLTPPAGWKSAARRSRR
jgi:hypothetical protein